MAPRKQKTGWQWGKQPRPEVLARMPDAVVSVALPRLRDLAPEIGRWIVGRVRRGIIARHGHEQPMPPYSGPYTRLLARLGLPTAPDLSLSGGMLDHLRGRIVATRRLDIELRISPYGRATPAETIIGERPRRGAGPGGEVREGFFYRPAYTYVTRSGKTVSVGAQWIRLSPVEAAKQKRTLEKAARDKGRGVYNSQRATYLAYRLGYGRWAQGGPPPSSFLTLSDAELARVWSLMADGCTMAASRIIARVAGS